MSKEIDRRRQGERERKTALFWKIGVAAMSAASLVAWVLVLAH